MKFNRKLSSNRPEVSTASLPDIIFMLLFFFMVVTVMREDTLKVTFKPPQATELEKLEHKSLIDYVYIGVPLRQYQGVYGDAPRLQLNNQISEIDDIPSFSETLIAKREEADRGRIVTSIRADKEVTMGIVTDVKTELRKVGRLKLNYSAVNGQQ